MAQVVAGDGRVNESRRSCGGPLILQLLIGARINHQHPLAMQDPAGYFENPGGIPDCPRSHQVETVAEVERLGARAFDDDVLQSHLDPRLAQIGRAFAPRLDQRDAPIDSSRDHQPRKAGAATDIENAMDPVEPDDPRAGGNRDWDNTVEDVEHDFGSVAWIR